MTQNNRVLPLASTAAHLYRRTTKVRQVLRICDGGNSRRGGLDFPSFVKAYASIFYPKPGADNVDSQSDGNSGDSSTSWDDDRVKGGRANSRKQVSSRGQTTRGPFKERGSKLGFRARSGSEGG